MTTPGTGEQWWWSEGEVPADGRLGDGLDEPGIWSRGTLQQQALTTTSVLPDAERWISFEQLITGSWDLCFGPSARWSLEVEPQCPIYEVNDAEDWVALVRRFPRNVMSGEDVVDGTELTRETGLWRRRRELAEFARFEQRVPGQRYASRSWVRFLAPDWGKVADDYSGVHLTWQGLLLADGTLTDLGDGDVTILRNWGSERTLWLAPVVTQARPLPIPADMLGADEPQARPADSPDWDIERRGLMAFAGAPGVG